MATKTGQQVGNWQLKTGDSVVLNVVTPSQIKITLLENSGLNIDINPLPPDLKPVDSN